MHPGIVRSVEQSSQVGETKIACGTQVKQPVASQVRQFVGQTTQIPVASTKKPGLHVKHVSAGFTVQVKH